MVCHIQTGCKIVFRLVVQTGCQLGWDTSLQRDVLSDWLSMTCHEDVVDDDPWCVQTGCRPTRYPHYRTSTEVRPTLRGPQKTGCRQTGSRRHTNGTAEHNWLELFLAEQPPAAEQPVAPGVCPICADVINSPEDLVDTRPHPATMCGDPVNK